MSVTVIDYDAQVPRWEPDSQTRLNRAALELFAERGFEQTTALEVAQRAGVTERTFFRHFTDKREVLFDGSAALQLAAVTAIAAAPASMTPIDVVLIGMESAASLLDDRHDYARERACVINANASLRERELLKLSTLAEAVADALRYRGVADTAAALTAEAGVLIFKIGFESWIRAEPPGELAPYIRAALRELASLTAPEA